MPDPADQPLPQTVEFHFIKASGFRVVHADGAWGGVGPRGAIQIAFYSERFPIPQQVTQAVDAQGVLGDEISREGKGGVVREVEVEVIMDVDTAVAVRSWLDDKIAAARARGLGSQRGDGLE